MEEIRKKNHGRPLKGWMILALALMIAAGSVWLAVRAVENREEGIPAQADTRGTLVDRETEELNRATVTLRGGETWTLNRGEDGVLRLAGNEDMALDETLTAKIADALCNIVFEDVLTEDGQEWQTRREEFGLAEPTLIAEARYADGTEIHLRFGDESPMEDVTFCYMEAVGDDRLFAVATSLLTDLRVERALLISVTQPDIHQARLDRITVTDGDGTKTLEWKLQGSIMDQDAAENWLLTAPFVYPADFDTMSSLREQAAGIRLGVWVGPDSMENRQACGLVQPRQTLEIHLAAGSTGQVSAAGVYNVQDWEEESFLFEIGDEKNEMSEYVAFRGQIYTISRFTVEALTEADPMKTVARYPVLTPLNSLASLTVETRQGSTVYVLSREEVSGELVEAEETEDEQTDEVLLTVTKNGEEIETAAFEAAYERMLVVTVSGRLPADWEKQETETRYVFQSVSGAVHTVELSPWDGIHDAVTLDGETIFYLIQEGMGELP